MFVCAIIDDIQCRKESSPQVANATVEFAGERADGMHAAIVRAGKP